MFYCRGMGTFFWFIMVYSLEVHATQMLSSFMRKVNLFATKTEKRTMFAHNRKSFLPSLFNVMELIFCSKSILDYNSCWH